ncbi:MAG: hypothetical protein ACNA8W_15955 [Bradymonadaceae bacterium]
MNRSTLMPSVAVAILLVFAVDIPTASPCSVPCARDSLSFEEARVPANVTGVLWKIGEGRRFEEIDGDEIYLVREDDDGRISVQIERVEFHEIAVEFGEALAPNTSYRFVAPWLCNEGGYHPDDDSRFEVSFETGDEAPFPSALGALVAKPHQTAAISVNTEDGCSDILDTAYVDIALELSDEALPWHEALIYETYVDGQRWQPTAYLGELVIAGQSWQGRGRDRIYTICDPRWSRVYQAAEGTRTVEMRAWHPGRTALLATSTITIDLTCPEDETPVGGDVSETPGDDVGHGAPPDSGESSGGCATSPPEAPASHAAMVLLLLCCIVIRRRNRAPYGPPST